MLADEPIDRLLELIAARTPAPGGGSAAACAAAMAAALEQMAAGFMQSGERSVGLRSREGELHAAAGELRAAAPEIADRELHSYGDLLKARRLPEREPGRAQRIAEADHEAIAAPLELCRCAGSVAELGAELAREGNRNLAGDAICATLLAEAACRAAATLVQLNLIDRPGDQRVQEAGAFAERAQDARRRALS